MSSEDWGCVLLCLALGVVALGALFVEECTGIMYGCRCTRCLTFLRENGMTEDGASLDEEDP